MHEKGSKDEESKESSNGKVDESANKDEESEEPSKGKVDDSAAKTEESKEPSDRKVDESAEYILQFGTDTDVCDEQSRTYKEETLQIKVFASQLQREINHAEVVKEQLEQDVKVDVSVFILTFFSWFGCALFLDTFRHWSQKEIN